MSEFDNEIEELKAQRQFVDEMVDTTKAANLLLLFEKYGIVVRERRGTTLEILYNPKQVRVWQAENGFSIRILHGK